MTIILPKDQNSCYDVLLVGLYCLLRKDRSVLSHCVSKPVLTHTALWLSREYFEARLKR